VNSVNPVTACLPTDPWLAHSARIQQIIPETTGVATYDLVFDDPALAEGYTFRPGQFNMLYLPGVGEIAISICGDPADRSKVPHTVRLAGNVTTALAELPAGASIGVRGPFGSSWPVEACEGKDVILIAGGIGLPPLRPVIYSLLANRAKYGRIWLLYGARTPEGLLYPREHETWRQQGLDVQTIVDRSDGVWTGNVGVVTVLLDRLPLDRPSETLLLTCGPEIMMWYSIQTALGRGLRQEAVYLSLERNMNCAIGLCGHCQYGPEFLCKDGPVFRYDRVAPILKVDDL
jgi:NAD(P)H-flavin reductase